MDESEIALAGIGRKFQKPLCLKPYVFENIELSLAGKGIGHLCLINFPRAKR